jgi:hypothetical protein
MPSSANTNPHTVTCDAMLPKPCATRVQNSCWSLPHEVKIVVTRTLSEVVGVDRKESCRDLRNQLALQRFEEIPPLRLGRRRSAPTNTNVSWQWWTSMQRQA